MPVNKLFDIIFEDPELLVIDKPAGLVCHPTKTDEYSSLIGRTRLHLGPESHPQMVNRLDRETSGVVLVAKTALAARQLRQIWEGRQVEKVYLAIVHGYIREGQGTIDAPLGKDLSSKVAIKDCVRPDGQPSQTDFEVIRHLQAVHPLNSSLPRIPVSLVRVRPRTGRKHQIRVHFSNIGHPLVGDKLYGPDEDLYLAFVERRLTAEDSERLVLPHHALCASEVTFIWRNVPWRFVAAPEPWFTRFLESAPADA